MNWLNDYRTHRCKQTIVLMVTAIATVFTTSAVAQTNNAQSVKEEERSGLEEIVVTGSRVARSGFDTPTPTTVIDAIAIEHSGVLDIGTLLQQTPQIGASLGRQNDQFSRDMGSSFTNLRGLGANRTLVLIDGRRRVSAARGGSQVDLSLIPASMIERVEIITGGASAVYGADAVSGVINVILKHDFEGLVLSGRGGISQRGDGETYEVSMHGGHRFAEDRGSASFAMTVQDSSALFLRDRSYLYGEANHELVPNPNNTGPADGIPDNISLSNIRFVILPYHPSFVIDGQRYVYDSGLASVPTAGCIFGVWCSGGDYGYDYRERSIRSPSEDFSAISNLEYVVAPNITAFSGLEVSHSETSLNGQSVVDAALNLSRENPTIPAEVAALMDANNLSVLTIAVIPEERLGRKQFMNKRFSFTAGAGLKGQLADSFDWELFYQYGRNNQDYRTDNTRIESRFFEALDVVTDPVTGNPICRSASARAAGCVPFDYFGAGPASAAEKAYFQASFTRNVINEQTIAGFQITGDLFELPAGAVGIAAGAEHRKESLTSVDDELAARGLLNPTDNGSDPVDADVDISELFVEAVVPVLKDVPLIHDLSIEGALRWSDYSSIGSTTAYKLGMNWSPIDSIRFRGTLSESVRAPNIVELYSAQSRGIVNLQFDPCDVNAINLSPNREANCRALGIPVGWVDPAQFLAPLTLTGGNPDLSEEKSDSRSVGAVLTPAAISGLRVSADFWTIEITGAVESLNPNSIVQRCVDLSTLDNVFCPAVTRGNFPGIDDPFVISQIDVRLLNIGFLKASGVDAAIDYRFPLRSIVERWGGDIRLSLSAVYLRELSSLVDATEPESIIISEGSSSYPTWRGNFDLAYTNENLTVGWNVRYVGSTRFDVQASRELYLPDGAPSMSFHDLFLGYDWESVSLNFGVNNVFDTHPPETFEASQSYLYDYEGLSYFVMATKRF